MRPLKPSISLLSSPVLPALPLPQLRAAGLSAAIIDKATFPCAKLCGGLITGRSRDLCCRIFGRELDPALFEHRDRITFYAMGAPLGAKVDSPPI
ncbi:hypothetical protein [Roseovarius sp. Pro17]|uniref:hypothetical protein n=1 Tax=Roseovarius sp. Pro17 TaxID=3108175 RepID=UPI002D78A591|nr:hypothetical protein [Roseovarius sp. Pro17]